MSSPGDAEPPLECRRAFLMRWKNASVRSPILLRTASASIFGLQNVSLRDVFWVGDLQEAKYSCLSGIRFVVVDRRQKRPRASLACPNWAQPIYVLQNRGWRISVGFLSAGERRALSLCSVTQRAKLLRLRNGVDAEVVGRVVGSYSNTHLSSASCHCVPKVEQATRSGFATQRQFRSTFLNRITRPRSTFREQRRQSVASTAPEWQAVLAANRNSNPRAADLMISFPDSIRRTVANADGGAVLDLRRGAMFRVNPQFGARVLDLLAEGDSATNANFPETQRRV